MDNRSRSSAFTPRRTISCDNHVFIPIEAFRETYHPGGKLSKIFVTVDSVAHVEPVVADLKAIPEVDVVTTPKAVSTVRTTLGSLSVASAYAAVVLFAIGAVLIVFVMILSTRERIREIGTLKAIGASNREVVVQFLAETVAVSGLGGLGALFVAAALTRVLSRALGLPIAFDATVIVFILAGSIVFAALGSLYPVAKSVRLSPALEMCVTGGACSIIPLSTNSLVIQGVCRPPLRKCNLCVRLPWLLAF